jgi:hypothetical protein
MLKKICVLSSCLIFPVLALAQTPPATPHVLGKAIDVQGLVTVSNGTQISGVTDGSPVIDLTRYVTSSTGFVTLKFEHCEVKLKPNEAVTVDERKICDGMIAAIETLPGGALAGTGPGFGLAAVGIILIRGGGSTNGGNNGGTPGGNNGGAGGDIPTPPILSNQ